MSNDSYVPNEKEQAHNQAMTVLAKHLTIVAAESRSAVVSLAKVEATEEEIAKNDPNDDEVDCPEGRPMDAVCFAAGGTDIPQSLFEEMVKQFDAWGAIIERIGNDNREDRGPDPVKYQ